MNTLQMNQSDGEEDSLEVRYLVSYDGAYPVKMHHGTRDKWLTVVLFRVTKKIL